MKYRRIRFVFASAWFVFALILSARSAMTERWDRFVGDFLDHYFALNPDFAVFQGKHEYDGILPDWSEAGIQNKVAWLEASRTTALAYKDVDLDAAARFERDYLVAQIRRDLFWLKTADLPHRSPYFYADALDPDIYLSRPYAPLATRLQAFLKYSRAVPAALAQIKENLRGPQTKALLNITRRSIGGLADFYELDVPQVFDPELRGPVKDEFVRTNAAATKAVREFTAWLGEREKTASTDFAYGPEKFRLMLQETEGVDLTLAELEEVGRKDLARNRQAIEAACALFAPGVPLREAVARAMAHKPEGGVVPYARLQLKKLEQFVRERNLVTVPGTEQALVAEAPAYRRWNFAYINIPGPYEKGLPSIYYVAPPDPAWSTEKQRAYIPGVGNLQSTSVHEVWPGHFLQFLHANRASSRIGRVFVGYSYAEGWAHYAEEMVFEAGLDDHSPEMVIGQLMKALLRDVRFLSAIGLHTQGMTVAESEKMFRDEAFSDEGTAEQQANRGTFDPAYLNYTLGKLMIRKLRADWTSTRGGQTAWREFHDAFLSFGGPPVPLVRRAMLGDGDHGSLF